MTDVHESGSEEELELRLIGAESNKEVPTRASTQSLIVLGLGFGGLQLVFATIFSHGSAFLNSLNFSKPIIALIWIAGPLCGATLQPYFGICTDQYRSRYGKRRPFILSGAGVIIVALLGLGWSKEIGPAIASGLTFTSESAIQQSILLNVVFCIFALNAAIQPLQCGLRSLVVDICPKEQQEAAHAWIGRFISVANVLNYSAGYADLPRWLPWLGSSQFPILCVITSLALAIIIALTCFVVQEQRSDLDSAAAGDHETVLQKLRYLCTSFPRLPKQVRKVCWVQFFAWMGWFPFLYYIAVYIGIIFRERNPSSEVRVSTRTTGIDEEAARMGSFGLFLFAVASLLAGAGLPALLSHLGRRAKYHGQKRQRYRLENMQLLWIVSHILFASCMWLTLPISSLWGTYVLLCFSGFSWAVTIWAPFAIIGMAIAEDGSNSSVEFQKGETRPGVVLSLHNVAIATPQVAAAVGSSFILWALDGGEGKWSPNSIGWTLRIAALSTIAAAVLTRNVVVRHDQKIYQFDTYPAMQHACYACLPL
ncbi:hypothetical protein F5Y19DRAFT_415308 [Xylariaceae sp. FL1651]|nr:hypothetical protein F5Y19DRAFT_415308 [Xylariaceae sp. FL1651]